MRILVFQHLPVEHPGSFRSFWKEDGHQWDAIELDEGQPIPPFDGYDMMVSMGGPMDVWEEDLHPWIAPEKAAIRHWVRDMGRPFLGVCLGHQLLAEALGGKVGLMSSPEVGLADVEFTAAGLADPIFADFGAGMPTFQWHGAEIQRMPEGGVVLARNAACATQAMRWGRHAYGLQYHVEITADTVTDWQDVPQYRASLEQALGRERAEGLADEVIPRLDGFGRAARHLYRNLTDIIATSRA